MPARQVNFRASLPCSENNVLQPMQPRFLGCYMFFLLAPNILGGHSGPFSLHLSRQDSV